MSKARNLSDFISDATIDSTEIADLSVTHAKLHTDMNLSSKTLTFAANQISGNSVDGGVISNFASTGIDDNASATSVTILSDGNVGIGTTNPQRKLVVYQGDSGQAQIQFQNVTTGSVAGDGFGVGLDSNEKGFIWNYEGNDTYIGGAGGTSITIQNGGNVGIGTSSPEADLQIAKSSNASAGGAKLLLKPNGAYGSIVNNDDLGQIAFGAKTASIDNTDNDSVMIRGVADGTWASNDYPTRLEFWTTTDGVANPTERMRIDASGVVKIGGQTGTLQIGNDATYYADIEWEYNNNELAFSSNSGANFTFNSGGTEHMRIDSSGNLIVGNAGVSFTSDRLQVKSTASEPVASFYRPRNTAGGGLVRFMSDVGGTQTIVAQVSSEGQFHGKLGTTTAAMVRATQTSASASAIITSNNGSISWSIKAASDSSWYSISGDRFTILKSGLVSLNVNQDIITSGSTNYVQCRISVNGSIQAYQLITNTNSQWNAIVNHWNGYLNVNDYIQLSFQASDITSIDHGNWSNYDFMWIAQ